MSINFQRASDSTCIDCQLKKATFVNMDIGSYVCSTCATLLTELGFKLKAINLSHFSDEEKGFFEKKGNDYTRGKYYCSWDQKKYQKPIQNRDLWKEFLSLVYLKKCFHEGTSSMISNSSLNFIPRSVPNVSNSSEQLLIDLSDINTKKNNDVIINSNMNLTSSINIRDSLLPMSPQIPPPLSDNVDNKKQNEALKEKQVYIVKEISHPPQHPPQYIPQNLNNSQKFNENIKNEPKKNPNIISEFTPQQLYTPMNDPPQYNPQVNNGPSRQNPPDYSNKPDNQYPNNKSSPYPNNPPPTYNNPPPSYNNINSPPNSRRYVNQPQQFYPQQNEQQKIPTYNQQYNQQYNQSPNNQQHNQQHNQYYNQQSSQQYNQIPNNQQYNQQSSQLPNNQKPNNQKPQPTNVQSSYTYNIFMGYPSLPPTIQENPQNHIPRPNQPNYPNLYNDGGKKSENKKSQNDHNSTLKSDEALARKLQSQESKGKTDPDSDYALALQLQLEMDEESE